MKASASCLDEHVQPPVAVVVIALAGGPLGARTLRFEIKNPNGGLVVRTRVSPISRWDDGGARRQRRWDVNASGGAPGRLFDFPCRDVLCTIGRDSTKRPAPSPVCPIRQWRVLTHAADAA
ncbi:hypothetical protein EVAR_97423_1 [Eumeta japonica]|uniref:Uncharacterized protein n=1 Tax=Eumeta variegata TaxID=151549 RepID=A0A4C1WZ67_EUMVA|nr:hypothetical protein EVAR_97423_1 [Eumeta japonica]